MYRILVIEDDTLLAHAIKTTLEAEGYSCLLGTTEKDLENQGPAFQPHVILIDLCVRGKTVSYEKIKRLRDHPGGPAIILMTGHLELSKGLGKRFPGIRHFLTKPFSRDQLLKTIQECMDASGQAEDPNAAKGGSPSNY